MISAVVFSFLLFPNFTALRLSVSSVGRLGVGGLPTTQQQLPPQIVKNLKLPGSITVVTMHSLFYSFAQLVHSLSTLSHGPFPTPLL